MIFSEIEQFTKLKNILINEYKYDEKDIKFEEAIKIGTKIFRPDIIVYKNHHPFIVIELKTHYSVQMEHTLQKLFDVASAVSAPYAALIAGDFIDVYKFESGNYIPTSNIPNKADVSIDKNIKNITREQLEVIFNDIREILWAGGKRDEYTVINEFCKILLTKSFDEIENEQHLQFKIQERENAFDLIRKLFDSANKSQINIFSDQLNLNQKEIHSIVRLLERYKLTGVSDIEVAVYNVFLKNLKTEPLPTQEFMTFLERIIIPSDHDQVLFTNSQYGQLVFKFSNTKFSIKTIENNKLKYAMHKTLAFCKKEDNAIVQGDFLEERDSLNVNRYDHIISIPPFGYTTKDYPTYDIDSRSSKDIAALYIDKSSYELKENGLLYIVVPDGFLSYVKYKEIRQYIKKYFDLIGIVSLSKYSFDNTNINSSLLILKKNPSNTMRRKHVLVCDLEKIEIDLCSDIIQKQIKNNSFISDFTINADLLHNRWDTHYHQREFYKLEEIITHNDYLPLGELVQLMRGGNLRADKKGTEPLINASCIEDGVIKKEKLKKVLLEDYQNQSRGIVQKDDILITVAGKIGYCAKVTEELVGSNTNSAIVILRLINTAITSDYLLTYLNSKLGQKLILRLIQGNVVPVITQTDLENLLIVLNENDFLKIEDNLTEEPRSKLLHINEDNSVFIDDDNNDVTEVISFKGLKGNVFGLNVIRSFVTLEQLKYFETDHQKFQRQINEKHKNDLIDFIQKKKYLFFPELVIAITKHDELAEKKLLSIIDYEECDLVEIFFNENEITKENIFQYLEVLDGRHRIESIKKYLEDPDAITKNTISVVFILLDSSDALSLVDRAIFYNLNAKAKPLLPTDYLNILNTDDQDSLNELGIVNITLFKFFSNNKDKIFAHNDDQNMILEKCIELTDYIVHNHDNETLINHETILSIFQYFNQNTFTKFNFELKTKLYKLIVYILSKYSKTSEIGSDYIEKEINALLEWLNITGLMQSIEQVDDLKDFYKTCQETYVPKSRRIFISMPYHKETEWTYYLIKDVVHELSTKLKIDIKIIRTDKEHNGVHSGIREAVYKQIEESDLMIADLTGNNPNVFNEVGFKMGLDRAKGLEDPQIIFIVNSKSYYEEILRESSKPANIALNEIVIEGKIIKNESKNVAFNLSSIKQITFYESHFLKTELFNELSQYFQYYKISKSKGK